jgi:hypothetical protein
LGAADIKLLQLSCGRFFMMVVNLGSIPWMAANRLAGDFGLKSGRGNSNINYLCDGSNLTHSPKLKTTFKPN